MLNISQKNGFMACKKSKKIWYQRINWQIKGYLRLTINACKVQSLSLNFKYSARTNDWFPWLKGRSYSGS